MLTCANCRVLRITRLGRINTLTYNRKGVACFIPFFYFLADCRVQVLVWDIKVPN